MSGKNFGGNLVSHFNLAKTSLNEFAREPYLYSHYRGLAPFAGLPAQVSATIYVLNCAPGAQLKSGDQTWDLLAGSVIQIEGRQASSLTTGGAEIECFVAAVQVEGKIEDSVTVLTSEAVKKVSKPWGFELWLNFESPNYAFKKIFIKAGTKTSLQYHQFKRETNLIFDGQATFHYKSNPQAENDRVEKGDIAVQPFVSGDVLDVFPNHLHRIEALSDVTLFEVSTPHLNDVIRVSDDMARPNGRIEHEHAKV